MREDDEKYGPHLLYFLSIDIINSTSIKNDIQEKNKNSSSWSIKFSEFFNSIDFVLNESYKDRKISDLPGLFKWRIIGDEIVYFSKITKINHLHEHVRLAAEFSKKFNEEEETLKIKLTSWIAGFPVNNALYYDTKNEKEQKIHSHTSYKVKPYSNINFLGPCIDTGFRISKYAKLDKYVISIDLALVLLHYINENENLYSFNFYFDNQKETKGINKGRYPIVWINLNTKDSDEFVLEKKEPCCNKKLYKYCKQFVKSNDRIFMPFVSGDNHNLFTQSNHYKKELEKVKNLLNYNKINNYELKDNETDKKLEFNLLRNPLKKI